MIGKIFKKSSGSFKGRIEYIFGCSKHDHAISFIKTVGGNFFSEDPLPAILAGNKQAVEALVTEFDSVEKYRDMSLDNKRDIKPVFHAMLSLKPGESLSMEDWKIAVDQYMEQMGFTEENKYVAVMHEDTDHQHVHIVANRIKFEEKYRLVSDSNERTRNINVVSDIEDRFNLEKCPKPNETWGTAITHEEVKKSIAENTLPAKHKLIAIIASCIEKTNENNGDIFMFVNLLKKKKVYIQLTMDAQGQPKGIAYEYGDLKISGRALKRSRLTWQKLTTQEGLDYDPKTISKLEAVIQVRDIGDEEIVSTQQTTLTGKQRFYFIALTRRKHYKFKFMANQEDCKNLIEALIKLIFSIFGITTKIKQANPSPAEHHKFKELDDTIREIKLESRKNTSFDLPSF